MLPEIFRFRNNNSRQDIKILLRQEEGCAEVLRRLEQLRNGWR